jgi:hypothetical protein
MPSGGVKEGRTQTQQLQELFERMFGMGDLYNNPAAAAFMSLINGQAGGDLRSILEQLSGVNGNIMGSFGDLRNFQFPDAMRPFIDSLNGNISSAQDIVNRGGRTERSDDVWDRLSEILTYGTPEVDQASRGILSRGGWNPQSAGLNEQAQGLIAHGGFTAPLMDLQKVGMDLVGSQGQTKESREAINQFLNIIRDGGQDEQTRSLFGQGQGIVGRGGMTPEMSSFMADITGKMQDNGMTPEARRIFNSAMGIVDAGGEGGALLPQDQMITMAREASNTAMLQRANAARREMAARTGDALGAGTAGQALASFSDQAAQAESASIRDAIAVRQEQKMKQLLASMGVAGDVTGDASALLGQLSGAGADVFRSAASNMATGAGMMSSAGQIAADRLKTGTTGFNSTLDQELQRMNSGVNMVGTANDSAFRRLGLGMDTSTRLNTDANAQVQTALDALIKSGNLQLGAGSELARMFGIQSDNVNNALGTINNASGTGLTAGINQQNADTNRLSEQFRNILTSLGISADVATALSHQLISGAEGLNRIGSQYTGLANTALGGRAGLSSDLTRSASQPSFWQNLANSAITSTIGGLTGGLGNLIPRGVRGLGGGRVSGNPAYDVPGGPG